MGGWILAEGTIEMILAAYLGVAGLSDVGYRYYDVAEAAVGSRVTAGVVDAGGGWYTASATIASGAVSVRWDSTGNASAIAREYFECLIAVGTGLGQLAITSGKVDVNDKTGFALSAPYDPAKTASQAGDAMALTSGERTTLAGVIWNALTSALSTSGSIGKWLVDSLTGITPGSVGGLLIAGSNAPVSMNVTGNLIGNVTGDVQGNVAGSVASIVSAPTEASIAAAVRDVSNAAPAAGSLGEDIAALGSAGDPWATALPGAYAVGSAGKIIGDKLDAAVSSRLADADFIPPIAAAAIADAVRDVSNATPVAGSLGDKVNGAASAGDPWGTVLPGSYVAGTAGYQVGTNLDVNVASRLDGSLYIDPPAAATIAQSVRDIDNSAPASNSLGAAVNQGAAVPDPWDVALPGSYPAGSAGEIIGGNVDATVSSRSTYNGSDTSGVVTLLSRIASALNITSGKVDVADKTGFSLTAPYDPAKTGAQPGDAMTLTSGERSSVAQTVWNYLTSALATAGSIGKLILDNLNASISSRLSSAGFIAPDNAGVAAIKAKTDNLPAAPAAVSDIPTANQNAVAVRDISNAGPLGGSLGADVRAAASASSADPWAANLPGSYGAGTAGNILGTRLDVLVSSRLAAAAITLSGGAVTVGTIADKTGYALSGAQQTALVEAILKADWQTISGESSESILNAMRFLRNRWEVDSSGTLRVYKENGTDVAWSRQVTADAAAIPIVGVT